MSTDLAASIWAVILIVGASMFVIGAAIVVTRNVFDWWRRYKRRSG